ncbi:viral A-type inclusion protein repeat protein [Rhizophagus clarus]|nr:viral A-type inclusion protein repeat protein [Rhizophagus clarus]
MFSNFKDRINNGIQNIKEKQHNNGVDNDADEENIEVIPSSSNNSSNSSIGGLFPSVRRSIQSTRLQNSSASIKSEDNGSRVDVTLFGNEDTEIIEGFSNEKEKEETENLSEEIKEKLAKLKKYETKFPEIVRSYKKLLNEKKAVETVLRENTHLDGLSDVESFEAHLRNLNIKNEMSMEEIKRLTQVQDESKKQIEEMTKAHKSQTDLMENLQERLQEKEKEVVELRKQLLEKSPPSDTLQEINNHKDDTTNLDKSLENKEENSLDEVAIDALSPPSSIDSQTSKNIEEINSIKLQYEIKITSLQKQLDDIKPTNSSLNLKIEDLNNELSNYHKKVENLELSNLELNRKLEDSSNDLNENIKKLDSFNQKVQELEHEKSLLKKNETQLNNEISQLCEKIETLTKTQINNEEKLRIEFEQKITQLKNNSLANKSSLEKTIEELNRENENVRKELEQHHMALNTKIKEFEEEKDLITKQFDKKLDDAKIAKEKALADVVAENEARQEEVALDIEAWESERHQLESQIKLLQQEIEQLKQENVPSSKPSSPPTGIIQERDALQIQVEELRSALSSLKQNNNVEENQPDKAPIDVESDSMTEEMHELKNELNTFREQVDEQQRKIQESEEQIITLKANASEKDEQLNIVRSQLDSAKESIVKLEQTINEYRDKVAEIEKAKGNLQKNLDSVIIERDNLSKERDELKLTHDELSKQNDSLKSDLTNTREKLIELENQIGELIKERDDLNSSKEDLIKDLEIVQKKANDSRAKMDDEMEALRSKLTTTEKNYALLESDVSRLHVTKTDALEKLSDVESRLKSLTQRERELQESFNEAKSTIQKRDNELDNLKKQQIDDEEKRKQSLTLLKKTQQKINTLEKEKKDLSEEVERLQDAARIAEQNASSNLKEEVTRFNKELSTKSTRIAQLEAHNEKLTTEKEGLFDQLQMKEAEFESSQSLMENLQHRSTELTHQLKEIEEKSLALEEELTTTKRYYKEKSRENEALINKIEELDKGTAERVDSLRKQVETHKQIKEKAEFELREVKRTVDDRIQEMVNKLTAKDQEVKRLETKLEEKDNSIKLIKEENQSLKQQMLDIEAKMNKLNAEVANADEKSANYRELEHSKERIKEEYEKMLEESRLRESTFRTMNKTLQEEVRKLQKMVDRSTPSSPQPLSPGYSRNPSTPTSSPFINNPLDDDTRVLYIRDIVLKFLEYKDRRKFLLPVLTTVLQMSDQEKRKLESMYGK